MFQRIALIRKTSYQWSKAIFFPPPPTLLASVIGVTIVGPKNVPQRALPSILTVSRGHVRNALHFLVRENPLYSDVVISDENLNLLPEFGIPEELSSVIHVTDNLVELENIQGEMNVEEVSADDQSGENPWKYSADLYSLKGELYRCEYCC